MPAEEAAGWARSMASTFLSDPDGPDAARRVAVLARGWQPERTWGVRDAGRWVGTLRTEARTLTVPGGAVATRDLRVDAVTNVTVAASHRRRGLMSRMLGDSLAAAQQRGDPVSILIAAEWPIYGRFGYAPATLSAAYVLHRSRRGASCAGDSGRVRHVERAELARVAPSIHDAARRRRAGQVDRHGAWWDRVLGQDGYPPPGEMPHNWLVHDGDDGPDGLVAWTAYGEGGLIPPLAGVRVSQLISAGDAAYRDLWSYLSGIDGTDEVRVSDRPVDEPVRWLLADGRTLVMTEQVDLLWVRLLDVPAALAARRYAVAGDLVVEVIDEDAGRFASGRYRLAADGDEVACRRTGGPVDVEITQRALASIYLGGFRLRQLAATGAARERTPGALGRLDLMFSTPLPPWNATWF